MEELVALSRSVAAELASAFRNDPGAELAAWFRIALEREGLVASLYSGQSIASRLQSFPKPLRRSAIAKVNGICANEETHVAMIRGLLAAECPWPEVALREIWGRLQGIVLNQLAGTNDVAWAVALLLLAVGARSERERAAARAVAGFDAAGFLRFTRTLEITAVESYQRIAPSWPRCAAHRTRRPTISPRMSNYWGSCATNASIAMCSTCCTAAAAAGRHGALRASRRRSCPPASSGAGSRVRRT